jgi:predicted PolB exonuclease-like 3'-5' exonuclease
MNIFVFDIETVPDVQAGQRLHGLQDLDDTQIAQAMFALQRAKSGHEFLPHYLQRIVAISIVWRHQDRLSIWSLGDESSSEAELIQRFFHGLEQHSPTLVSWNGSGFDLPVLHYRSLFHQIAAPRYWQTGEDDPNFRWNNYLNRYHERHTDLMDVLAGYQARANAPLQAVATLLGFPGKMGMDGSRVWSCFQQGDVKSIRDYCETDVLNTFLVYLRYQHMRGQLTEQALQQEFDLAATTLAQSDQAHWQQFLELWGHQPD